ncbi:MAG: hypothetical protein ABI351_08075, partial [Herbaspirillum sp.]
DSSSLAVRGSAMGLVDWAKTAVVNNRPNTSAAKANRWIIKEVTLFIMRVMVCLDVRAYTKP